MKYPLHYGIHYTSEFGGLIIGGIAIWLIVKFVRHRNNINFCMLL